MKTAKELIKITFFNVSRALCLAFRPSATGAFRGRAPKSLLVPPSEDCAPKKLTGSVLLECKSSPETPKILLITLKFVCKNCFFADFAMKTDCFCRLTPEIMKLRVYFGTKTFIFCFSPQNLWKFARFLRWKPEFVKMRALFQMKTLFFWSFRLFH